MIECSMSFETGHSAVFTWPAPGIANCALARESRPSAQRSSRSIRMPDSHGISMLTDGGIAPRLCTWVGPLTPGEGGERANEGCNFFFFFTYGMAILYINHVWF
jgi:hypothetical protein